MRTQQQDAPGRLVTLAANIAADGSVAVGDGSVTVTKTSTGVYVMRWSGLRAIRRALATSASAGSITNQVTQPNQVQVNTYTSAGAAVDSAFHADVLGIAK